MRVTIWSFFVEWAQWKKKAIILCPAADTLQSQYADNLIMDLSGCNCAFGMCFLWFTSKHYDVSNMSGSKLLRPVTVFDVTFILIIKPIDYTTLNACHSHENVYINQTRVSNWIPTQQCHILNYIEQAIRIVHCFYNLLISYMCSTAVYYPSEVHILSHIRFHTDY